MILPGVSVVIPAWNASAWLPEALASVFAQSYPNAQLEIIVVDDGSTDATRAAAQHLLAAQGIAHRILSHDAARGPGAARNTGWAAARHDWIQFLDADDVLDPEKIEHQGRAASRAPVDVAVLFSPWTRLVDEGDRWARQAPAVDPTIGDDPVLDLLKPDNFIATGSQLFRRVWLEQVGGYVEAHHLIEDVDLMLRMAMAGGLLQRVPAMRAMFCYRQRPGSLSQSHSSRRAFIEGCLRNAALAEAYWRAEDALTPARAEAIGQQYFLGARFFAEVDAERFNELVERMETLCPEFLPPHPAGLRRLTRLLGYRRAEAVAVRYRHLKQLVTPRPGKPVPEPHQ